MFWTGDGGNDVINGGADLDVATYELMAGPVTASLLTNTATGDGSDTFVGIEHLVGSTGNDTLTGNGAFNFIDGFEGHDTISRGGSGDNLFGWTGNDNIDGDGGDDYIDGEDGTDDLGGGSGSGDVCLNGETNTNCEVTATTALAATEQPGPGPGPGQTPHEASSPPSRYVPSQNGTPRTELGERVIARGVDGYEGRSVESPKTQLQCPRYEAAYSPSGEVAVIDRYPLGACHLRPEGTVARPEHDRGHPD